MGGGGGIKYNEKIDSRQSFDPIWWLDVRLWEKRNLWLSLDFGLENWVYTIKPFPKKDDMYKAGLWE